MLIVCCVSTAMTRILLSLLPSAQGLLYLDYRYRVKRTANCSFVLSGYCSYKSQGSDLEAQGADKGSADWRNRFKPDFGNKLNESDGSCPVHKGHNIALYYIVSVSLSREQQGRCKWWLGCNADLRRGLPGSTEAVGQG